MGLGVHAGEEVGGVDPEGWHGFGCGVAGFAVGGAAEVCCEAVVEAGLVVGGGAVDGGSGLGESGDGVVEFCAGGLDVAVWHLGVLSDVFLSDCDGEVDGFGFECWWLDAGVVGFGVLSDEASDPAVVFDFFDYAGVVFAVEGDGDVVAGVEVTHWCLSG